MGINRFDIVPQEKFRQTYTPQYVPLPIDELDKALDKVETDIEQKKKSVLAFGDKEFNNLSPDQKRAHQLRAELDADIDEATNFALADAIEPGAYSKVKQHISDMTRKWTKEFKRGGRAYAMNANYNQRAALKKDMEEKGLPVSDINNYLRVYDSQYSANMGIGTRREDGAFNPYGSRNMSKYVDVQKKMSALAKDMKPSMFENLQPGDGQWKVLEPFFSGQRLEEWQQTLYKTKSKKKELTQKMIAEAITNAIYMDPEAMDYLYQQSIGEKYYKTGGEDGSPEYYAFRNRGDDEITAAVKTKIFNYANTLGNLYKQGEYMRDMDIKVNQLPASIIDKTYGKGGKKTEDVIVTEKGDNIQNDNFVLNNEQAESKTVNGDKIDKAIEANEKVVQQRGQELEQEVAKITGGMTMDEFEAKYNEDPNSIPGLSAKSAKEIIRRKEVIDRDLATLGYHKVKVDEYIDANLDEDQKITLSPQGVIEKAIYNGENIISNISDNSATLTDEKVVEAFDLLTKIGERPRSILKGKDLESKLEFITDMLTRSIAPIDLDAILEDVDKGINPRVEGEKNRKNESPADQSLVAASSSPAPITANYRAVGGPSALDEYIGDLMDANFDSSEIRDILNSIKGFDNNYFWKDQQDVLSNIYDERQKVLDRKEKLKEQYVEEKPELVRTNKAIEYSNMIPIYKSSYENGKIGFELDENRSKEGLDEVTKYLDVAESDVEIQWGDASSSYKTLDRYEKENEVSGERERSVPMYSPYAYVNKDTGITEGGYLVKYTWKDDNDAITHEMSGVIPESRVHINKYNDKGQKEVVIAAGEDFEEMKSYMIQNGLGDPEKPWSDDTKFYLKGGTIAERAKFVNQNGSIKAYVPEQVMVERQIINGTRPDIVETGNYTLLNEEETQNIIMKDMITSRIFGGEIYRDKSIGAEFKLDKDGNIMGIFPGGISARGKSLNEVYYNYELALQQKAMEAKAKKSKKK
jgi:hypothetical protein